MPLDAVHPRLPTFADVEEAAARLKGLAVRTPLIESPALNERTGGRVLLKPETLQRSGSFKFRGAYNRISRFSEEERKRGVVAYSSGNHAQGVAAAARIVGTPALIVMPSDAPAVKVAGVQASAARCAPTTAGPRAARRSAPRSRASAARCWSRRSTTST